MKVRVCIYVEKETWKQFLEICRRETRGLKGGGASQKINQYMTEYTRLHAPGNPQQTLTRIVETGEPYIAPKHCDFCGKPAFGVVVHIKSGVEKGACKKHFTSTVESGKWKEVA